MKIIRVKGIAGQANIEDCYGDTYTVSELNQLARVYEQFKNVDVEHDFVNRQDIKVVDSTVEGDTWYLTVDMIAREGDTEMSQLIDDVESGKITGYSLVGTERQNLSKVLEAISTKSNLIKDMQDVVTPIVSLVASPANPAATILSVEDVVDTMDNPLSVSVQEKNVSKEQLVGGEDNKSLLSSIVDKLSAILSKITGNFNGTEELGLDGLSAKSGVDTSNSEEVQNMTKEELVALITEVLDARQAKVKADEEAAKQAELDAQAQAEADAKAKAEAKLKAEEEAKKLAATKSNKLDATVLPEVTHKRPNRDALGRWIR